MGKTKRKHANYRAHHGERFDFYSLNNRYLWEEKIMGNDKETSELLSSALDYIVFKTLYQRYDLF